MSNYYNKFNRKTKSSRKKDMAKTLMRVSKPGRIKPGYEKGVLVIRRNDKGLPKTKLKWGGSKYINDKK
jgi:hypothetical protein